MTALVVLLFVTFMQQPVPVPVVPTPSVPGAGGQVQGGGAGASVQTWNGQSFGTLLYDGAGVAGTKLANGGFKALDTIWSLPNWLGLSRLPQNTVDQPQAAQLNDDLIKVIPGLVMVGMVMVVGANVLGAVTGKGANPVAVLGSMTVVALAALVAVENREIQRFPIDMVNMLLNTISGAPIQQFAQPGLHVSTIVDAAVAALFAIAFFIVLLLLTFILFLEGAWCIVLGSMAGLLAIGCALPIFGGGAQFLLRRWLGSLFSPVVVFAALRLAAPVTNMMNGVPDLATQFLMMVMLWVAWQAPGLVVGAIAVSFPGVAQMYFAGRLLGAGRMSERVIPGASGAPAGPGGGGSRTEAPRSRSTVPISTRGGATGRGAGSAVTRRMAALAAG